MRLSFCKKTITALAALAIAGCMAITGYAYEEVPAKDFGAFNLEGFQVEADSTGYINLFENEVKWAAGGKIESRNPGVLTASIATLDDGTTAIHYTAISSGSAELVVVNKAGTSAVNMGHVLVVGDSAQSSQTAQTTDTTPKASVTPGWVQTDNVWKYQNADSSFKTNEWVSDNGKWYYMGENGVLMANQWLESNGKWYYLTADGSMAVSTTTPDGYKVDKDGVMQE